ANPRRGRWNAPTARRCRQSAEPTGSQGTCEGWDGRASFRLQRSLDITGMAVHFDFSEDGLDFSRCVNDEGAPLDPPIRLSVHVLELVHVVGLRNFSVLVGEQREGQAVLLDEFFM